jgi:hypothetical protein
MRFSVSGVHRETGKRMSLITEAATAQGAEVEATSQGMLIESTTRLDADRAAIRAHVPQGQAPRYIPAQVVGFVMLFLGCLIIIISVRCGILAAQEASREYEGARAALLSAESFPDQPGFAAEWRLKVAVAHERILDSLDAPALVAVAGVAMVGLGLALLALRDMAINSWHVRFNTTPPA